MGALVPSITAARLSCIWELPEPAWVKGAESELNKLKEPTPELPKSPKDAVKPAEMFYEPPPEAEPEPAPVVQELMDWSLARSFKLCKKGEEKVFRQKGIQLLAS